MYFPTPELVIASMDTLASYKNHYQLFVNIFDKTTNEALSQAQRIVDNICKKRLKIPVVNEDTTPAKRVIKFTKISADTIDRGISQITLQWSSSYFLDKYGIESDKIQKVLCKIENGG